MRSVFKKFLPISDVRMATEDNSVNEPIHNTELDDINSILDALEHNEEPLQVVGETIQQLKHKKYDVDIRSVFKAAVAELEQELQVKMDQQKSLYTEKTVEATDMYELSEPLWQEIDCSDDADDEYLDEYDDSVKLFTSDLSEDDEYEDNEEKEGCIDSFLESFDDELLDEINFIDLEENDWEDELNEIPAEDRIAQLVGDFMGNIHCSPEYKDVLEKIFWGVENTHVVSKNFVVRRSKSQESTLKKLIKEYGVSAYELELIYTLKSLWRENSYLWASITLKSHRTQGSIVNYNYKTLSWEVGYSFIRAFPYLSDDVLIDEFLRDLYDYWFETREVHGKRQYRAFLFYLQDVMEFSFRGDAEIYSSLGLDYRMGLYQCSGLSSLFIQQNPKLKMLRKLDVYAMQRS